MNKNYTNILIKTASKFEQKYIIAQKIEDIWQPHGGPRPAKPVWLATITPESEKQINSLISYTKEAIKTAGEIGSDFSEIENAFNLYKQKSRLSLEDQKSAEENLLFTLNKKRTLIEKLILLTSIVKSSHDRLYLK